ncbi:MAG: EamA family transporter [Dinghuibacter sp.]|nr:EamA family transporter [Dinghuibacter sp.]
MKKALVNLNIAILLWGFTGVLGKLIILNEGWLVWYRMLFSTITVWVMDIWLKEIQKIPRAMAFRIGLNGGFQAVHWVLFFGSIHFANISVALVCLSGSALFTSLTEPILNRRRINIVEVLLGLVGMAGIYLIFRFESQFAKGIVLGVLSALVLSFTSVFTKRFLQRYEPVTVTAWSMTGGWLFLSLMLPGYLYFFPEGNAIPSVTDIGWLLVLACLCTVYTWRLALRSLQKVSAFTLTFMLNLEPVYGIVMAFMFFKEHKELGPYFYVGLLVIAAAVLLHIRRVLSK